MSAYTVATIDGDSTGLVNALGTGGKAMQDVQKDARKLSDQLREVKDDADKAAGSFVQRLGGNTAIKAIAGVSAVTAGVGAAFAALSGSMSSFYASQGAEGAEALTRLTRSIDDVQGKLFAAVMGTDNAAEATKRLIGIISAFGTSVEFVLFPVKKLAELLWGVSGAADSVEVNLKKVAAAQAEVDRAIVNSALGTSAGNYQSLIDKLDATLGRMDKVRDRTYEQLDAEIETEKHRIEAGAKNRALQSVLDENARFEAGRLEFLTRKYKQKGLDEIEVERAVSDEMSEIRSTFIARRMKELRGSNDYMSAEELKRYGQLNDDQFDLFVKRHEKQAELTAKPPKTKTPPKPEAEEPVELFRTPNPKELVTVIAEADETLRILSAAQVQAYMLEEDEYGAHRSRMYEISYEELAKMGQLREDFRLQDARAEAENAAAREAAEAAARAEKLEKDKKAAEEKAALDKAAYHEWVGQNAKQVAIGIGSGKKLADVARAQLGSVISGLGDKALTQAGIMYAAGDVPGAVAMTAAGMAAYATAAAMGSTAKKAAASTPAAAPQAAPQNISYNLRVDAAFADGELVARQFARMQREAGRRGFAAAGAY